MELRALALAVSLAACGGAKGDPDGQPDAPGPGACGGLSLGQLPLVGIYHGDLRLEGGYETATSFRIDRAADGLEVSLGGNLAYHVTPVPLTVGDDAIAASTGDGSNGRTLSITSVDGDCTLHGTWTVCSQGSCYPYALLAQKVDRLDEPVAQGMTLLGEFVGNPGDEWTRTGIPVNMRVANGLAYLSNYEDGLRIVDVHDPAHLVELGHLAPEYPTSREIYNDVKVVSVDAHTYALVASDVAGIVVVDVTTPAAPAIVAHFGTAPGGGMPTNVHTLFLDGGKAYLANIDLGLEIWDLADPVHPLKLGGWAHDAQPDQYPFPHDLYVSGARAYVNYWDAGMSVVDVSTPAAPALIGDFAGYGQHTSHSNWVTDLGTLKVAVHGDEQWDAHVHVVDVTEGSAAFGTSIGEWKTRPAVSVHNIMAFGSRAYMAYYQDGIRVLDLSDPQHPTPIAWFDTWPGYDKRYGTSFFEGAVGIDVDLDQQRIYVADTLRGLIVLHLDI